MRCATLLERPWSLKHKDIVRELIATEQSNMFDGTIRDWPQQWTTKVWKEVYRFSSGGASLANWMDTFVDGKFAHMVDPKVGYLVRDYRDVRNRRLLEFIVPIIHPNKPTEVTIMIGNTIFGALDGGRPVDWGLVFRDLALRLVPRIRKPKSTSISPFLFHIYDSQGLLKDEEETDYKTTQELAGYQITPEPNRKARMRNKLISRLPHQHERSHCNPSIGSSG